MTRVSVAMFSYETTLMRGREDTILGVYEKPEDALPVLIENVRTNSLDIGYVEVYELGSTKAIERYAFDKINQKLCKI